jgi:hypothetical protein
LDIFQQTLNTHEPMAELVTKEMWFSNITKWIPKKTSVFFNGGQNMKPCFLQLDF